LKGSRVSSREAMGQWHRGPRDSAGARDGRARIAAL
jgi:hypothetical protein